MRCVWCEQDSAKKTVKDCTWIDPTGKEVLTVKEVPAIDCPTCQDVYVEDEVNEEVEAALHSVELDKIGLTFTYSTLMNAPRKSIFDLFQESE
ncbi:YokU family protein [Caldalkalibacillus salinus]|uniref:YokU family protein n=1 Tax=Caldalkalibacillus salinus TaxID=2803787 RepID=UPI001920713F